MEITFDPNKDCINIEKHGVSLADAENLEWDIMFRIPDTRLDYGESRFIGYSLIEDRVYCVVYTERCNSLRIISLRKTNKREVANYVHNI